MGRYPIIGVLTDATAVRRGRRSLPPAPKPAGSRVDTPICVIWQAATENDVGVSKVGAVSTGAAPWLVGA